MSLSFAPSAIFMFPPKYWVLGAIAKTRGPSGAASQVVHRLRNKNDGVYELALLPGLTLRIELRQMASNQSK